MKYVPDKLWSTLTVWGAREEGGEVIRTLDTLLICSKSTWIQIFSSHWDPVLKRIQQQIFFFCFLSPLRFCVLSLYCTVFTVQSAAPQTALWGGPRPRSGHQMGSLEAGDTDHTTPPPPLLNSCILFRYFFVIFLYLIDALQVMFSLTILAGAYLGSPE